MLRFVGGGGMPVAEGHAGRAPVLGSRLVRSTLAVAGLALLVTGTLMGAYAYVSTVSDMRTALRGLTRVTAYHSAAAAAARNAEAARDGLASLRATPVVVCAEVRNADGSLLASYRANPSTRYPCAPSPDATALSRVAETLLFVQEPLVVDGRIVGQVVIGATKGQVYLRVGAHVLVTVLAAALALGLACLLVLRLRRQVDVQEVQLAELAFFDPVTGLPNRRAANARVDERVAQALAGAETAAAGCALALFDLDDFKVVNDTLGHTVGDQLLGALGKRLSTALEQVPAEVFRYGGDEFLVMAHLPPQEAVLGRLGQSVLAALQEPFTVGGHQIRVHGSVGVAHCPRDAGDGAGLLRAADLAMYRAKSRGKRTSVVYEDGMSQAARRHLMLLTELKRALENNEFTLDYQPIWELAQHRLAGFEALVRWDHPTLGLLGPMEFIPAAEESGLIVEIGHWVLNAACAQMKRWHELLGERPDLPYVAVNVSAHQLKGGVAQQIADVLDRCRLESRYLEIEITEYSLVEALESNVAQLSVLRARGVEVAVDDFGTGLSSLAYLKRLPIDKLKIDRSFVKDLPDSRDDAAIAKAIVTLAHSLGLRVVAEGIETEAQQDYLRGLGCELGQGYLLSRPLAPARAEALLRQRAGAELPAVQA